MTKDHCACKLLDIKAGKRSFIVNMKLIHKNGFVTMCKTSHHYKILFQGRVIKNKTILSCLIDYANAVPCINVVHDSIRQLMV
jgi:hypothetical protein